MYPIYHFIFTVILSGFLWPVLGWKLALFWLGSFFIDVDHYWWYVLRFRRFSLREAYRYYNILNIKRFDLQIFHTIEFWVLIGLWSLFSEFAFVILLGLVFHIVMDITDMIGRDYTKTLSFFKWYYSY